MKNVLLLFWCSVLFSSFNFRKERNNIPIVTNAAMPSVTKDEKGNVYIVFASGDKLEYVISADNGIHFSKPVLVDTIKDLYGIAGRGPHIISTSHALTILAPDKSGNIHAYTKDKKSKWIENDLVNDVEDVCKEGFVSLSGKGDSLFAAWLDVRNTNRNKIAGALSIDGGKTWSKNKIIYQSPDGVVCECCRVSVAFGNNGINVMFRNNLDGNRNLYIIQSYDGAKTFSKAIKLGEGNWKLDGCPMDGGGIVAHDNGTLQTVWRRFDTIYSCVPEENEEMIGKGKNCTVEKMENKNAYAWIENNTIVCLLPNGKKVNVGEGTFPVLKSINENQLICVWQKDNNVYRQIITL